MHELDDFLESNLYLFTNDFEFDINKKEDNNRFFASFSNRGIYIIQFWNNIREIVYFNLIHANNIDFKINETIDETNEHLIFFEKYLSKYNELYDDISNKEFVDSEFKKKLFEKYLNLNNELLREKKELLMENYEVKFFTFFKLCN